VTLELLRSWALGIWGLGVISRRGISGVLRPRWVIIIGACNVKKSVSTFHKYECRVTRRVVELQTSFLHRILRKTAKP